MAESDGLLIRYTSFKAYRGFESLSLRTKDNIIYGEVTEWSNVLVLKTRVPSREPWVRIPPSPHERNM